MKGFSTEIKVRFADEDHAQVVYYPRYFDYFHRTFEDFFDASGQPFRDVVVRQRIGWPVVRAEARFAKPVSFGDTICMTMTVEKLGRSSCTFAYRGVRMSDGEGCVEGRNTVVCVSMKDFASMEIPPLFREQFARLQPDS